MAINQTKAVLNLGGEKFGVMVVWRVIRKYLEMSWEFFSGVVTLKRKVAINENLVEEFRMFKANDKNCTTFQVVQVYG